VSEVSAGAGPTGRGRESSDRGALRALAFRLVDEVEFRELWPEYETPNELARKIVRHLDASLNRREIATLPARLMVTA
jgi:hypothetical protein